MIEDFAKWDQVEGFITKWSDIYKKSMKKLSKVPRKREICSQNGMVTFIISGSDIWGQ